MYAEGDFNNHSFSGPFLYSLVRLYDLMEVLRGKPALFMHRDEVDAAWQWIDTIIDGWKSCREKIESYGAGSWEPIASSNPLDRDGCAWQLEN